MVCGPRGGWCYEMNGLLGWALESLGFDVVRMCGGVSREVRGDESLGDHLVLRVQLDRPYLADAGLIDGLVEPIPIEPGEFQQGFLRYSLEALSDGFWRFHNQPRSGVKSFDFRMEPADEALFARQSETLQTSPASLFVTTLVCGRFVPKGIQLMIGRVRKDLTAAGVQSHLLNSADELVDELDRVFGIRVDGVAEIWPRILERHESVFGDSSEFDVALDDD